MCDRDAKATRPGRVTEGGRVRQSVDMNVVERNLILGNKRYPLSIRLQSPRLVRHTVSDDLQPLVGVMRKTRLQGGIRDD